jgi:hypothetical protein
MTLRFRRYLACILLTLLPLQGMAKALCAHGEHGTNAAMAIAVVDTTAATPLAPCLHDQAGAMDTHAGHHGAPSPTDQDHSSCGAAGAMCAMCFLLINTPQALASAGVHPQSNIPVAVLHLSFIPEGLQRPPNVLA